MRAREGFTIVELLVSLLVLSVAVLALATALGYTILQLRSADARTERSMAVTQIQEELRSRDFSNVTTKAEANALTVGDYDLWWDVVTNGNVKRVTIYSKGPGVETGGEWSWTARDSSSVALARIGT